MSIQLRNLGNLLTLQIPTYVPYSRIVIRFEKVRKYPYQSPSLNRFWDDTSLLKLVLWVVLRNVRRVPLVKSWRPRKWPLYLEGALNLTLASCQCLERRFDIGLLRLEWEKQCFSVQMRKVENHVLWTFSIIQFAKPKKKTLQEICYVFGFLSFSGIEIL